MKENSELREDDSFFEITRRYTGTTPSLRGDTRLEHAWIDATIGSASLYELINEYPDQAARLVEFAAAQFALMETPLEKETLEAIQNYDLSFERGILAAAFTQPDRLVPMEAVLASKAALQPVFTTEEWNRLLSQIGYGNPKAAVWFLGMEEGLDETYPIDKNLRWRLDNFTQPFDTMSNHLQAPWIMKNAAGSPVLPRTQTWPTMAKIARARTRADDWQDLDEAKNFVLTQLGTDQGQTLLLELLPLPMSHHNGWLDIFDEHFPGGIAAFREDMLPRRINLLKDLISDRKPSTVICYGKANWKHYEKIFPGATWMYHQLDEKTWAKKSKLGDTTVLLTPFFGVGALSGKALRTLCALLAAD